MSYSTLDDLRSQLGAPTASADSQAYAAKMLHVFPDGPIVDRPAFILDKCRGQRVVDFGASGPMHEQVKAAAEEYKGVDRVAGDGVIAFDCDDVEARLPALVFPTGNPTVILCGEILEHLSNPGHFLARVRQRWPGIPVVITVPNAFTAIGQKHLKTGYENVNIDHVAWYSPRTLRTLVERVGYTITAFAYYNGTGPSSEGLIAVVE